MTLAAAIHQRLATLAPESVELLDESGQHVGHEGAKNGGSHFRLVIVSREFANLGRLARHRKVYDALGQLMQKDIHALAIQALTPEER
jgi:BolA protein